jgi:hypothetical protein
VTRKHFLAIAAEMRNQRPANLPAYADMTAWERGAYDEWHTVVLGIAGVLHAFNGRFDRDRFLTTCGA